MKNTNTNTIEINDAALYVGTYHKYNCGSIEGEWVKLLDYSDKDDFLTYCAKLHKDESDPEFMFQDYENLPADFYSECSISAEFWEFAEKLQDENIDYDTFCAWANNYGRDLTADAIADFQDAYMGDYDSENDFADELAEQNGWFDAMEKFGMNASYFDTESFARDLFMDGFTFINGSVFADR